MPPKTQIGKNGAHRSFLRCKFVYFFVEFSGETVLAATITFSDAGTFCETSLRSRLQTSVFWEVSADVQNS